MSDEQLRVDCRCGSMHYMALSLWIDGPDDPHPVGYVGITAVPRTFRDRLRALWALMHRGPRFHLSEEIVIDPDGAAEIVALLQKLADRRSS